MCLKNYLRNYLIYYGLTRLEICLRIKRVLILMIAIFGISIFAVQEENKKLEVIYEETVFQKEIQAPKKIFKPIEIKILRLEKKGGSELEKQVLGRTPIVEEFISTGYCACTKCCGKTDGITASGSKAKEWYTIAADSSYEMGTIIYIPELKDKPNKGWFIVQDRGGAIKGNKIDIYFGTHEQAVDYAKREIEVHIYKMKEN